MKLKEVVRCLTKYYKVFISSSASCYEDQTIIPDFELNKEVETFDFHDGGDGVMLWVNLREEKIDSRQMTFDDLKE